MKCKTTEGKAEVPLSAYKLHPNPWLISQTMRIRGDQQGPISAEACYRKDKAYPAELTVFQNKNQHVKEDN